MSTSFPAPASAWNEAHDRLENFLATFQLGDHAEVSRLTLKILERARELHRQDPAHAPLPVVMTQTRQALLEWFGTNLEENSPIPSQVFSTGCLALYLSRFGQVAPAFFLASPLPEDLRQSLRQTLLVTGPDLQVSSMTPRHLDYGPMLNLARQTWHLWNGREIFVALLFWAAVYFIFYWWLSHLL